MFDRREFLKSLAALPFFAGLSPDAIARAIDNPRYPTVKLEDSGDGFVRFSFFLKRGLAKPFRIRLPWTGWLQDLVVHTEKSPAQLVMTVPAARDFRILYAEIQSNRYYGYSGCSENLAFRVRDVRFLLSSDGPVCGHLVFKMVPGIPVDDDWTAEVEVDYDSFAAQS